MAKTICPRCQGQGIRQDWLPPSGMNPWIRQYRCNNCGLDFYAETARKPLLMSDKAYVRSKKKDKPVQSSL